MVFMDREEMQLCSILLFIAVIIIVGYIMNIISNIFFVFFVSIFLVCVYVYFTYGDYE